MVEVREADLMDRDTIVDFQLKMALETEDLKLDEGIVSKGVQAVFSDPRKGKYYLAVEGDEVIGGLLTLPEWSDWRNGNVLWIHSVYIKPEHRKKGAYKLLYAYLKSLVDQGEYRGLRLYVDKTNIKAQKVYQNLGMTNHHYELYEWLS